MTCQSHPITVAIPTFRRENVLLETVAALLALEDQASEILVLDQTEQHEPATEQGLRQMADNGQIRWLRLAHPSIPKAMNVALMQATMPLVLFLDDDIRPEPGLIGAHCAAHEPHSDVLVAGKVLQPWDEGRDYSRDTGFHFATSTSRWIREFMGGNFSVRRAQALTLGGFDENFVRVAYRFEAEFAHRLLRNGGRIFFEPGACVHHLKVDSGGTRTYGEHLTTWRPDHAVGAYYYALRTGRWREFIVRPARALATRHHLRHPWHMPGTVFAELGGMFWALGLSIRGPRHIGSTQKSSAA
jgi:GT2 family glycosyltransferase